jgi:hypothetical protein
MNTFPQHLAQAITIPLAMIVVVVLDLILTDSGVGKRTNPMKEVLT